MTSKVNNFGQTNTAKVFCLKLCMGSKVNQICKYFARYFFVQMCKYYSRNKLIKLECAKNTKCMFEQKTHFWRDFTMTGTNKNDSKQTASNKVSNTTGNNSTKSVTNATNTSNGTSSKNCKDEANNSTNCR